MNRGVAAMINASGYIAHVAPPAEVASRSIVLAQHVFAAARRSFDVVIRGNFRVDAAKAEAFTYLPLLENGWDYRATGMRFLCAVPDGNLYRMERCQ